MPKGGKTPIVVKGGAFLYFVEERAQELRESTGIQLVRLEEKIVHFDLEWKQMSWEEKSHYRAKVVHVRQSEAFRAYKYHNSGRKSRKSSERDEECCSEDEELLGPMVNAVFIQPESKQPNDYSPSVNGTANSSSCADQRAEYIVDEISSCQNEQKLQIIPLREAADYLKFSHRNQHNGDKLKEINQMKGEYNFRQLDWTHQRYGDSQSIESEESEYYGDQLGYYAEPPIYYGGVSSFSPGEIDVRVDSIVAERPEVHPESVHRILNRSFSTPLGQSKRSEECVNLLEEIEDTDILLSSNPMSLPTSQIKPYVAPLISIPAVEDAAKPKRLFEKSTEYHDDLDSQVAHQTTSTGHSTIQPWIAMNDIRFCNKVIMLALHSL